LPSPPRRSFGGLPKLICAGEASAAQRSFGGSAKLRQASEAYFSLPKLRRLACLLQIAQKRYAHRGILEGDGASWAQLGV